MLYDASRLDQIEAEMFELRYWQDRRAVAGSAGAGRGTVYFLMHADEQWALRHYRRGGMVGKLFDDHFSYLGENATRCFREFRLLANLSRMGLPVPAPVAACYRRLGLAYTADLISVRIPGAEPLSRRLSEGTAPEQLWEKAGTMVRRFHDAGVYHADLTAHNILADEAGQLFLLDFDRGRMRADGSWKARTLERLHRSFRKITQQDPAIKVSATDWQRFMAAYGG
jgi:3-deoxy-D-manno-octulosonic acid kinase